MTQSEAVTVPYSIFAKVSFEKFLSILQISCLLFIHEFYGINYQMSKLAHKYSPKMLKLRQLHGGNAPRPGALSLDPTAPDPRIGSRSPYLVPPPNQIPGSTLGG